MRTLVADLGYMIMLFVGVVVLTAVAVIGVTSWHDARGVGAIRLQPAQPECVIVAHHESKGTHETGYISDSRTTYTGSACRIMLGGE